MRICLLLAPLAMMASPALAQSPAPTPRADAITVPPELTDPAMADKLGRMMQALSKAFLNLPVGELEAAAEGRAVTPADRARTVRDVGRLDDPDFERNIERTLADSQAGMQASMRAFAAALPAMTRAMSEMARELERATANMPSPNYPRR